MPHLTSPCTPYAPVSSYRSLAPDEPFAFIRSNTFLPQPSAHTVRYRGAEYTAGRDRFFFQWWNYLIVDSASHQQYQLIYQLSHQSSRASVPLPSYSVVGVKHQRRDKSSLTAAQANPFNRTRITLPMDLAISDASDTTRFTQRALDDDTYEVTGYYPASHTSSSYPLSYHLTFHRIHGLYTSPDREASDVSSCTLISNHFAYSSTVSGWWSDAPDHNATFDRSDRFRAYAAASWGCQLPHTDSHPPFTFPWTWIWLAVPSTPTTPEFSLCLGTARLEAAPLGALYAGVSVMGIGDELVGLTFAYAWHNSSLQAPLLSAASDGYLAAFDRRLDRWVEGRDEAGRWRLPLVQEYRLVSKRWAVDVRVESEVGSYFRAPVVVEDGKDGRLRLFSDFRACENAVTVRVERRGEGGEKGEVVYDGPAAMNAAEFAYEAELDESIPATIAKLLPRHPQ